MEGQFVGGRSEEVRNVGEVTKFEECIISFRLDWNELCGEISSDCLYRCG